MFDVVKEALALSKVRSRIVDFDRWPRRLEKESSFGNSFPLRCGMMEDLP